MSESKVTLNELLAALEYSEDFLADFDPDKLIGTLEDKIDSVHVILERMEATVTHLKDMAKPFTAKASAIENSRKRLREYVAYNMRSSGFQTLPGKNYKAFLNTGPETLVLNVEREPTAKDYSDHAGFVEMNISFSWNKTAIFVAHSEGKEVPPFVSVGTTQSHWVKFKPFIPESLEPKKKGKKKT